MMLETWVTCERCDGTGEMSDYGVKRICMDCSTPQPGLRRWRGYVPKLMPAEEVLHQAQLAAKNGGG